MTGGDTIGLERKYSNHECSILGVFCVLITCNSRMTVILDGDRGAWLRRLIILTYEQKTHTKNIPHFAQKLVRDEGPGILNWALEGLELANKDVATIGEIASPMSREHVSKPCSMKAKECVFSSSITSRPIRSATLRPRKSFSTMPFIAARLNAVGISTNGSLSVSCPIS